MNRAQAATQSFREGFSCSQAVFSAFCEVFGLDKKKALKISQPFGGGMAHLGEMCGAVTGAFLVIGLKYGRTKVEDTEAKEKTYALVQEFVTRFQAKHGSTNCRALIGFDLGTPEGLEQAKEKNVFETLCPIFVNDAVEILEQIL